MTPRWTLPDPRIDAVRGCVAVERGPLVLCAESVDLPGRAPRRRAARRSVGAAARRATESVVVAAASSTRRTTAWPYVDGRDGAEAGRRRSPTSRSSPYNQWANRGPSTMRVWLPTV